MIYQVDVVNPKTSEEQTITVELTAEQVEAVSKMEWWDEYVWALARADMPAGFMPIGTRTRPLPLTAIN